VASMWSTPSDVAPRHSELAHEPGGVLTEGALPAPGAALPGDVLIRTLAEGPHRFCTLSAVPGPPQLRFPTLAEASRAAREYAAQRQVDVWTVDGAGTVMRISRFRTVELPRTEPGFPAYPGRT